MMKHMLPNLKLVMNEPKLTTLCNISWKTCKSSRIVQTRNCSYLDQFDPPYLDKMKPEIPEYDTINVQMKGHDFAVLENYQSFVNRLATTMDIDVEDGWATPATYTKIQKFKPNSSNVECEYTLPMYERNIQVVDVPSTKMVVFAEAVQTSLPQGVQLSIHEHLPEHDDIRYVPDYELKELKTQLETFGTVGSKKK